MDGTKVMHSEAYAAGFLDGKLNAPASPSQYAERGDKRLYLDGFVDGQREVFMELGRRLIPGQDRAVAL
jgi:hypothetical protein